MASIPEFNVPRDRDAYFVIRGFRYQISLTILRLLQLQEGEHLELERGEDIDRVCRSLIEGEESFLRYVEQVKHVQGRITLRTPETVTALANAYATRLANPTIGCRFLFCTNATPTSERPSPFPDRVPAIEVWEHLRLRVVTGIPSLERLSGLRNLLVQTKKPRDVPQQTWAALVNFFRTAKDAALLDFIDAFQWNTGIGDVDEVDLQIERLLKQRNVVQSPIVVHELHARLVLFILKRLSSTGIKIVTRQDLEDALKQSTLTERDQALLNILSAKAIHLEEQMSAVNQVLAFQSSQIEALELTIQREAVRQAGTAEITPLVPIVSIAVPPPLQFSIKRQAVSDSCRAAIGQSAWINVVGPIGVGKTQFAISFVALMNRRTVWISLRNMSADEAAHRISLALSQQQMLDGSSKNDGGQVGSANTAQLSDAVIVFDDLPLVEPDGDLHTLLFRLVSSCEQSGAMLLSTSHYSLSNSIAATLKSGIVFEAALAGFGEEEIDQLLASFGAPTAFRNEAIVKSLRINTAGHPVLVVAAIKYAQRQNWNVDAAELPMFSGAHESVSVTAAIVRRILATVPDSKSRHLLYRLGLIISEFAPSVVPIVAAVQPSLESPTEKLTTLLGTWVEEKAESQLSVSPLIRPLSMSELSEECRVQVWSVLADHLLRRRTMGIDIFAEALAYLRQAKLDDKFAYAAIIALTSTSALPSRYAKLLLQITGHNGNLPNKMSPALKLYLSARHAYWEHRLGIPIRATVGRIRAGIKASQRGHEWAVFVAAMTVAPLIATQDFESAMWLLKQAHRAWPQILIGGKRPAFRRVSVGALTWLPILGIKTPNHLRTWLRFIEELSPKERKKAFRWFAADDGCKLAINHVWMAEHERAESVRDWHPIYRSVTRAARVGKRLGIQLLWATGTYARILVRADYLKDLKGATKLTKAALRRPRISARSRFLLLNAIGRQFVYAKQFRKGAHALRLALNITTKAFAGERVWTWLELAKACGRWDSAGAIRCCEMAVELGQRAPRRVGDLAMATALGELGIARWLADDLKGAFDAFDEAVEALLRVKQDSEDWKGRFVIFAHVCGYLSLLAREGRPPTKTLDGDPFVPPDRGMIMSYHPDRASYYDDQRTALFYAMLAGFAEGVESDDRAARWAIDGIERARRGGLLETVATQGLIAIYGFIHAGQYLAAMDLGVESWTSLIASKLRHDRGERALQLDSDVSTVIGSKPNDSWNEADRTAVIQAVVPIVFKLGRQLLTDRAAAVEATHEVVTACNEMLHVASDSRVWEEARDLCANLVDESTGHEVFLRGNTAATEGRGSTHILAYLVASIKEDTPLPQVVVHHAIVLSYLAFLVPEASALHRRFISPFIEAFWTHAFENRRFVFTNPMLTERELSDAAVASASARPRRILKAVISGLRVRLPETASQAIQWLNSRR